MKGENKALSMIVEIFPTYIFLTEYSHTLDEEFKYIKNLKWREPKSSQINLQSIETRLLHCKELFKIKKFIHKSIIEYLDQDLLITQSWANKNPVGTEHPAHNHANSIVSGVFYFQEDCMPLQFNNISRSIGRLKSDINSDIFKLHTKAGGLVLFPSHLWHSVLPNQEEVRYSISFNTFSNELGNKEELTYLNMKEI